MADSDVGDSNEDEDDISQFFFSGKVFIFICIHGQFVAMPT
jgi:hypothetical protein